MSGPVREWSPARGLVGCAWIGAAAALAWFVATALAGTDPAGLLLAGVAALGLVVAAAFGSRARPRLRVDAGGVTVGGLLRARHYPWPLVADVRVLQVRRFGRRTSMLEVDTVSAGGDERLLVFGRLELAADPEDVAPQVLALRPTTRP
jgi:Bacterial PH domain